MERRLAGRVPRADHEHLLATHGTRFRDRAVEDSLAYQPLQRGDGQPVVSHAGCQHYSAAGDLAAVRQGHDAVAPLSTQTRDGLGVDKLGTELEGLIGGASGQLLTADTPREAQVVADHGTRSRLPTGSLRSLAADFGVSHETIRTVVRHERTKVGCAPSRNAHR